MNDPCPALGDAERELLRHVLGEFFLSLRGNVKGKVAAASGAEEFATCGAVSLSLFVEIVYEGVGAGRSHLLLEFPRLREQRAEIVEIACERSGTLVDEID